jgi:outer membrane immunogenic protein
MMPLGAAQAQAPFDWSGFYAGVHGGFLSGNATLTEFAGPVDTGPISGVVGGPLGGYNFAPGTFFSAPVMFGVEGDFGFASVTGTGTSQITCPPTCDGSVDLYHYDLNWDAHLRARAGAPIGNVMPFVAAGLALADLNVTEDVTFLGGLYTGWTVGTGVDVAFGSNMVGRAEVLYDSYGTKTYTDYSVNLTAWTGRVALIFKLP